MARNAVERFFGKTTRGDSVKAFVLTQVNGFEVELLEYGATLRSLKVPVDDEIREVVLGCDSMADYEAQPASLGAVVGRCANRTGHGKLHVDGTVHQLTINLGDHHLHGGEDGFGRRVWSGQLRVDERGPSVRFVYFSPAGEAGYPGNLEATVDYTLDASGRLWIEYRALCDAPTAINLTNHAYFNLGGMGCVHCRDHRVSVQADRFVETDDELLPTGQLLSVVGTPLDLRQPRLVADGLGSNHPVILLGQGYDHTLVFSDASFREVARVESPDRRVSMSMSTDQPSVQFYTGNFLAGTPARGGGEYGQNAGLCLEAQGLPDASKHEGFPSIVLRPGDLYQQCTVYAFTT